MNAIILNFRDRVVQSDNCLLQLKYGARQDKKTLMDQEDFDYHEDSREAPTTAVPPEILLPDHLTFGVMKECLALFVEYRNRFYGGHLGRMRFPNYELHIIPDYIPIHAKSYPIARSQKIKAK